MEISILVVIGIAIGTMFFGYFFGLLEGRGQANKKLEKEMKAARQAPPPVPATPAAGIKDEPRNALLELRLTEAGRPQLHLDGREVDSRQISAEQRRRLIDLMVMLKPWIEPASGAASAQPSPVVKPAPADGAQVAATSSNKAVVGTGAPAGATAVPAVAGPQMSLVAQIDSILQTRIAGTRLAEKGIRLAESLHGGAIVFVGSTQYDGVDKVPDPEVQAAIRAAIADWEEKFPPK